LTPCFVCHRLRCHLVCHPTQAFLVLFQQSRYNQRLYVLHRRKRCLYADLSNSAFISSSMVLGAEVGKNLSTGFPCRSMRNLVKFQGIFPPVIQDMGPGCFCLRNFHRGCALSPLTSILAKRSNEGFHFFMMRSLISAFVPGSCPPN